MAALAKVECDDHAVGPRQRSYALLCSLLPDEERESFRSAGFLDVSTASGRVYRIYPFRQTEIFKRDRLESYACLQLTVAAPAFDRMIAEYLILRNDERFYRSNAHIYSARVDSKFATACLLLIALDVALVMNLIRKLFWK